MKQPSKIPTAIVSLLGCWGLSFTGFAQPLTPDDFDPVRYYLTSSGVYQAYSVVPLTNRMLLVGSEGQDGHGYVDQLNKVYDDGTRVEHFDSRIRGACTSTFYTLNCTIPRIFAIAELPDGKVLAGGHFDLVDGAPQKSLARHTPAGLIDSTFSPPELDGDVHCIAVLDDGKILIGGAFTLADGLSHRRVARLLPDGRLDPSFNGGVGSFDHNYTVAVRSLALQSDGKIVIGGTYNGNSSIARLNSDGSLDSSFSAQIGNVACLIAEPDGKILVGGGFTSVNGIARSCLARLNSDGSLDPSFTAEANDRVDTMIRQADGRFLIGGQFSTIGGVAQATVARLSSDGIVDAGFNITVQNKDFVGMLSAGFVRGLSLQHNGAVLVAGQFGHVNGFDRIHVARIPNDTASTQDLQISPSGQIDWLRGGSAPEVDQVVFEIWNDDHWDFLVSPNRVLGGWQATAGSLPAYGWVRARGRAAAGFQNGSSMIVEQIAAFGADNLPDLVLEDEDGNEIHSDGKPIVFGTTYWPNGGETRSFTVRNAGSGILDGLALEWEGGDIGDFILSPLTTDSIAAVSDLTFSVTFDPSSKSVGDFVVHLVLKSSDGDEPVIRMVLTGDRENRDPEFEVGIEGAVQVIVPLPDGRILVGGGPFERADGNSAGRLARLYSDGSLDLGFRPNFDNSVACASYLQDGSILVGGPFTSIDGVTCNHIARLTTEGVVDPSFQPDADDAIGGILPLADGAILVSGVFTSIGGIYQAKLARLFPDGSVDSAFDPAIDGAVGSCVVQADGKIVIGGSFQNVNGVPRNRMARLHPDGSLDMTFDPNVNGSLNVLAVQPDGRILLGGSFTAVGGTTRNRAARLFADGSLDPSFDPNFSGAVESMVLQSDGALTVSGSFYSVGGVSSGSLVRFDPAGNWNPSFPTQSIGILALQRDGRLLGGGYTLRRMLNDTVAEESLGQNGVADIQWNRSGSAPEVDEAWFESSDGTSWQFLAQASRVTEGWEATGLSLPQDGLIRARGRSAGGNDSGSSTVITEMLSFGQPAVPDIAAETSNGAALQPLDVIDLGGVDWQATSPPHLITIRNSGNNTLSGLAVRVGGVDAGKFIVGSLGATSLAPGASTTLSVAFAPSTGGEKHALVSILSNDPDEPVFEIGLKGTGLHSDPNFNPTMLGAARYALPLSDGRIIVGGWNYSPDSFEPVGTVVRLLMDGSVDPSFHPPSTVPSSCAAVLPDGKILVGGLTGLVRLLPDGAIDPSFGGPVFPLPTAFVIHSAAINLIVPQPDGRILIGGTFGSIHGSSRNLVARLHPDGSLDTSFDAHLGTDWYPSVDGLLVLPDSRILVSGHFSTDGALSHANLVRLQPDGSLDESFAYSLANWASKIALQPDGKILSVGYILPGTYLKRHNADGSLDGTFAPIVNDYVNSMAVAADGKIVIGGVFTEVNGTYCNRIARLNPDGTLDPAFAPDANGEVYSVALQPDGQVLIGGTFTRVGGRDHAYVARIPNNISSQSTVTLDGMGGVDWTRDGSAPEIELAAFERWNGNTWTWVGTPDRIANGWTATGLSLPQAGWIRARGLARSGQTNGSESSIEDVVAYPDPVSAWRFLHFGTITETGNAADLLDPDMDGLVNKLERVLNRDPNRPTPHPLHLQPNGDQLVCTYTRSSAAYREGTIFEIRWSDNLVDWFTTGVTQVILSDDGLDQLVRVTISAPLQGRRFVQLMAQ